MGLKKYERICPECKGIINLKDKDRKYHIAKNVHRNIYYDKQCWENKQKKLIEKEIKKIRKKF